MDKTTTALEGLKRLAEKQRNERGDYLFKGNADPEIETAIAALEQVADPVGDIYKDSSGFISVKIPDLDRVPDGYTNIYLPAASLEKDRK